MSLTVRVDVFKTKLTDATTRGATRVSLATIVLVLSQDDGKFGTRSALAR